MSKSSQLRMSGVETLAALALARASGESTLVPRASWKQASWFVDPQNVSGHASDANDGLTALTPLKTYAEIVTRWGTFSPILVQTTTITFLSSHTDDSDPVIASPILSGTAPFFSGVSLVFVGGTTRTLLGTIAAVVAQNRATGQLWQANIGTPVAPFVGQLFHDITTGAFAYIRRDAGADLAELQQPMSQSTVVGVVPTELTVGMGDSFEILEQLRVNFVRLSCTNEILTYSGPDSVNGVVVTNLVAMDPSGFSSENYLVVGTSVHFLDSTIERVLEQFEKNSFAYNRWMQSVWCKGGVSLETLNYFLGGEINSIAVLDGVYNHLDGDIILSGFFGSGANSTPRRSFLELGKVFVDAGASVRPYSGFDSSFYGTTPSCVVWGPGRFDVELGGSYNHKASDTYTSSFLQTGGMSVGAEALDPIAGQTGAAASITSKVGSTVTLTGLAGMTAASVGHSLTMSGAASAGNNSATGNGHQPWMITAFISATSVEISNPNGVAPDANNGAITWQENTYSAASFDPSAGTWHSPIAVTPTTLDAAVGAAGFGGVATSIVGRATLTNGPFDD